MARILSKDLMAQLDIYQAAVKVFGAEAAPNVSGGDCGSCSYACAYSCSSGCRGGCSGGCSSGCMGNCRGYNY
jgi:hypothetical protein